MKHNLKSFAFLIGLGVASWSGSALAEDTHSARVVVPGSDFHGIHGIAVGPKGDLFAGSVNGQAIYRINPTTRDVSVEVAGPVGMADDVAFGPDGLMAWTGFLTGDVYARDTSGNVRHLAKGLPGINSLAFRSDGRLYASQVFLGDALYEIDVAGKQEPRKIAEGFGGLNGFQFGKDNKIYGPLWFKGQVARVDADTGEVEVLAEGLGVPAAVNLDSDGNIWVVDTSTGELVRLDANGKNKTVIATLDPALDNLDIGPDNRVFVTNMADNGIQEIDPKTGAVTQLVKGNLASPGGIHILKGESGDKLFVADFFSLREVEPQTGKVSDLARAWASGVELPSNLRAAGGKIITSSLFAGAVQVVDPETNDVVQSLHGFSAPQDALLLEDGSLIVLELGTGSLLRVNGEDRTVIADGLVVPVGMVSDGADGVFVTQAAAGEVTHIELETGLKKVVVSDLVLPEGIDLAKGGELIVAEVGKKRIVSINPQSGEISVLASDLPIGLPPASVMPPSGIPTGVAVASDDTIYVTSDIDNSILALVEKR